MLVPIREHQAMITYRTSINNNNNISNNTSNNSNNRTIINNNKQLVKFCKNC